MILEVVLILVVLHLLLRPLLLAWQFSRPLRRPLSGRTPADWGAAYEDVEFAGRDGAPLRGWYIPSRNGAAVVLLHGHGGNRLSVAFHAATLSRAGYGVLLFDLRAHGQSGGRPFSRGVRGVDDALAAVTWLSHRRDVQARIGVLGISVGGMLALQAAARNVFIRAVVADGPLLGTIDDLPPPRGWFERLWRFPRERGYQRAIDWFAPGPRPPANMQALARLGGRPVLLISTGRGLEQRLTRHFFAAAQEPKTLYEIPDATHATGWVVAPEAYERQMLDFFGRALAVESDPDDAPANAPADEAPLDDALPAPNGPRPVDERTVSALTAMMMTFTIAPVVFVALLAPFQLLWAKTPRLPERWPGMALLAELALLLGGMVLRDAASMAAYRWIGRAPRGSTHLLAGPKTFLKSVGPRVRCDAPVSARAYRAILLLPMLLLGVLPGVVGVLIGSWLLLIWGMFLIVGCSGDLVTLWAIRGLPGTTPVRSHPTYPGCEVLAPDSLGALPSR
mgnify:CR=1 FL=1